MRDGAGEGVVLAKRLAHTVPYDGFAHIRERVNNFVLNSFYLLTIA